MSFSWSLWAASRHNVTWVGPGRFRIAFVGFSTSRNVCGFGRRGIAAVGFGALRKVDGPREGGEFRGDFGVEFGGVVRSGKFRHFHD